MIEVKNNKGIIQGNDTDETWLQSFSNNNSNSYRIRNPVRQVTSAQSVFSKLLAANGIKSYIQPVVVYSNPAVTIQSNSDSVPILRLSELSNYILTRNSLLSQSQYLSIYTFLNRIRRNKVLDVEIRQLAHTYNNYRMTKYRPVPLNIIMHDLVRNRVSDIMNHSIKRERTRDVKIIEDIKDKTISRIKPPRRTKSRPLQKTGKFSNNDYFIGEWLNPFMRDNHSASANFVLGQGTLSEHPDNVLVNSLDMLKNQYYVPYDNTYNHASGISPFDNIDSTNNSYWVDFSSDDYTKITSD